jgi:hypothetical protein
MKSIIDKLPTVKLVLFLGVFMICCASCSNNNNSVSTEMQAKIDSLTNELKTYTYGKDSIKRHLIIFDTLDFVVFTHQKWDRLQESHAKDIIAYWPDGHSTTGLDQHIKDMNAIFTYAPDTRLRVHPISFGNATGEWTCSTGLIEGTFTKPMPIGNGKFIQPTGKSVNVPMCTVAHWKDGLIDKEWIFYDNLLYMKQMGTIK